MNGEDLIEEESKWYKATPVQRVIHRHIIVEKSGFIIGLTGRPNFGKSWNGNKIILDYNETQTIDDYLAYDVPEIFAKTFENIKINGKALTTEEFNQIGDIKQWCKDNINDITTKMGKCLLVDEAGTSIYNRDFFSPENKAMSKLVQVWRFMRMLVIFVIPEKVEFLEKTLREFFDMKIIMTGKADDGTYAKAVAYERKGRNYKDEPIFKRIKGCRHGGFIKVAPLDKKYPEIAKEYERRSRIYKTSIIMQARRDVMTSDGSFTNKQKDRRIRNVSDFIEDVYQNTEKFTDINRVTKQKKISLDKIQNELGVGIGLARRIRAGVESKVDKP